MSFQAGTRWVPTAAGGMVLTSAAGTVLLTISAAGVANWPTTTAAFALPILTDEQRDALTAAEGMIIYNATDNKLEFYTGAAWEAVTSA